MESPKTLRQIQDHCLLGAQQSIPWLSLASGDTPWSLFSPNLHLLGLKGRTRRATDMQLVKNEAHKLSGWGAKSPWLGMWIEPYSTLIEMLDMYFKFTQSLHCTNIVILWNALEVPFGEYSTIFIFFKSSLTCHIFNLVIWNLFLLIYYWKWRYKNTVNLRIINNQLIFYICAWVL